MKIIIPARKGSKGLKYKNRYLFEYTANIIPKRYAKDVYVTSDDEFILSKAKEYGFTCFNRSSEISKDTTSIKDVLTNIVESKNIDDDILMLYLTYPRRTWQDVENFLNFYTKNDKKPTICKKDIDNHPFLCYYKTNDINGVKVVENDLYRRQDYPECFQISHFLFACKSKDLEKLDLNLYCKETNFYKISKEQHLDIDTLKDFNNLGEKNEKNFYNS